jgi:hypothetical protein
MRTLPLPFPKIASPQNFGFRCPFFFPVRNCGSDDEGIASEDPPPIGLPRVLLAVQAGPFNARSSEGGGPCSPILVK